MVDAVCNIDENKDVEHQKTIIKDSAATVYVGMPPLLASTRHLIVVWILSIAASDTTLSAVHTIFVAMLYFPDIQSKVQEELDRVLQGRLPEYGDLKDLPYVAALVKEVLQWEQR